MKREVRMDEISDGKLYGLNDMVKANCNDCKGCHTCCQGMGTSILLDPLDIYHLTKYRKLTFEELLEKNIELQVVDGVILPNLRMDGAQEQCTFLDASGRCEIHAYRPGICRLFPLGRYYENHSFQYFLQVHECPKPNKTKVKVRKWIDTPNIQENERYVIDWHYFVITLQQFLSQLGDSDCEIAKKLNLYLLQTFFITPYEDADFYQQFAKRYAMAVNTFTPYMADMQQSEE